MKELKTTQSSPIHKLLHLLQKTYSMRIETFRLSNWVDKKATEWTHGDSKRANFLAIDTANTIKSVSKDLDRKAN